MFANPSSSPSPPPTAHQAQLATRSLLKHTPPPASGQAQSSLPPGTPPTSFPPMQHLPPHHLPFNHHPGPPHPHHIHPPPPPAPYSHFPPHRHPHLPGLPHAQHNLGNHPHAPPPSLPSHSSASQQPPLQQPPPHPQSSQPLPPNMNSTPGPGMGMSPSAGANGLGNNPTSTPSIPPSSYHGRPCQNWLDQRALAAHLRQASSPHHQARVAHVQARGHSVASITDGIRRTSQAFSLPSEETTSYLYSAKIDVATSSNSPPSPSTKITLNSNNNHNNSDSNTAQTSNSSSSLTISSSSWNSLDLGGMKLRSLSEALFAYDFLTSLHIPHNKLVSLPASISNLRHLVHLDVTDNLLSSIPPELGLCTSLKKLLLFDNHLTTLPPELGTLYQLDLLGIDGNPLSDHLRVLAERDGSAAVIAHLRDSCPVPSPPLERVWHDIEETLDSLSDPPPPTFSVFCLNVLCEKYARPQKYSYTPSWALPWDYRKELVLNEIESLQADIICLQEVDREQYEKYFHPHLSTPPNREDRDLGSERNNPRPCYDGVHEQKSRARTMPPEERQQVDGCAIFWNTEVFALVEHQLIEFNRVSNWVNLGKHDDVFNRFMQKDNIAIVALLERKDTGARLIVANVQLHWDPEYTDVKIVQAGILMDELTRVANSFAKLDPRVDLADPDVNTAPIYSDGTKLPLLLCGDTNCSPSSGMFDFLTKSYLPPDHEDFSGHVYGTYTSKGLSHPLSLESAYSSVGELPFTNYTADFRDTIDFIFYTQQSLSVRGVLGGIDPGYMEKVVGFPNPHFPSDHITLMAEFRFR